MDSKVEKRKSKMVKLLAWFLFLAANCGLSAVDCFPATKVFLHDAASKIIPNSTFLYKLADATQGTAKVTAVTNSITGPVTGQYWPSATAGHIITKTAGGTKIIWITSPLSAGVTIQADNGPNPWGFESSVACNCGSRWELLRWSVATGGMTSFGTSPDNGTVEWSTTPGVPGQSNIVKISTTFVPGDRIVIVIYNDDGNAVTEASGYTWTLDYDGPTGVDGDTYVNFTETITFSADSNNAPARPGGTN